MTEADHDRPSDRPYYLNIDEHKEGKLYCMKNWHIIFENLKWQVKSSYDKLTKKEKTKLRILNANQSENIEKLKSECNKKEECETGKQESGIKLSQHLKVHLEYKCHCVGACPNKIFLEKHIAPATITDESQLPNHAVYVDKLRRAKGWEITDKQSFFLGAAEMKYHRDPNNDYVCIFDEKAQKYECTKQNKNIWKCEHIGEQIARHETFGGHYINKKNDLIDSEIDDSIDSDIDDSINSEIDGDVSDNKNDR